MGSKYNPVYVIDSAAKLIEVWKANPTFSMGAITLAQLEAAVLDLRSKDELVEAIRVKLTGAINERDDAALMLNEWNTRARSGIRATYGPNSSQYEQVGGTRSSERKTPTRKSPPTTKPA